MLNDTFLKSGFWFVGICLTVLRFETNGAAAEQAPIAETMAALIAGTQLFGDVSDDFINFESKEPAPAIEISTSTPLIWLALHSRDPSN